MSDGVCHMCFERSQQMKFNFSQDLRNTDAQEFVELFCQFVFNDASCTFEEICLTCWHTLADFSAFCEKIRGIHQNLVEVSCATGKYDEHTEVLEDEPEMDDHIEEPEQKKKTTALSIETDLGDEMDNFARRMVLTPKVIEKLEDQMRFEQTIIDMADMEFDRIARFVSMSCGICQEPYESFEECHEHYLIAHGRSATWNCCNLLLETPYDVLDHIKYHESIDVFKCAACSKCFLTSNKLKYHIRRTHLPVDGTFDCTICDKGCRTLRLLLNHQKSHIRIHCPHCKKQTSAANYDHHVRSTHAVRQRKIRPTDGKDDGTKKQNPKKPSVSKSRPEKSRNQVGNFTINVEPNENGMYECDICRMQFKQISLVFSHRNKVHV